jgi:Flp pilus assembly protein TadD
MPLFLDLIIAGLALTIPALPASDGLGERPARYQEAKRSHTPAQMRRTLAKRLRPEELRDLQIPFEADDSIARLAAELTRSAHGDHQKLRALRHYFRDEGFLERYDRDGTRTAQQVMRTGDGNCLSYANLFVAMARSVGLRAHYLDASERVDEVEKSGTVLVKYGHVLVGVRIGPDWIAVDFDGRAGNPKRFRVISDLEAIADFYNNLGTELAWTGGKNGGFGSPDAIRSFSLAARIEPRFSRAWNNLGVALVRTGRTRDAMRAYRHAIRTQANFSAPHANLGQIYRRQGKLSAAQNSFEQAVDLWPKNAHYRLFLARTQAERGLDQEALEQIEEAIELDPKLFSARMLEATLRFERREYALARLAAEQVLALIPGHRDATRLIDQLAALDLD